MNTILRIFVYTRLRIAIVALLLLAFSLNAEQARPNIIFILADDLGYGDAGFTWQRTRPEGSPRINTPNLDRLAREGAVLTDHYCCAPVCAPSRASILTGKIQGECSLRDNCFDRAFSETNTMGSVLKKSGYETWAVGKWGIAGGGESGEEVTSHPLDRGFDYFYGFLDHMAGHTYYHYEGYIRGAFMGITENRENVTKSAEGIYSTDLFTAKTKQLITEHMARSPEKPFFLYLAVNTVHGSAKSDDTLKCKEPVHVPGRAYPKDGVVWPLEKEPLESRNTWIDPQYTNLPPVAARYATSIARLDDALGDLMHHLQTHAIERNTLIIFTSDNGPANEYGVDPRTFGSAGPFDGMKRDVFEGGMRVPALVRWPEKIASGTVIRSPSQSYAWMKFIESAAEGRYEPMESIVYTQYEFPWDGWTEAFDEFKARKGSVRGLQQMVRVGDYVALRTRMREGGAKVRLYDVVKDPFQEKDLSSEAGQAERLKKMTEILDKRYRR